MGLREAEKFVAQLRHDKTQVHGPNRMVEFLFKSYVFIIESCIPEENNDYTKTLRMKQKRIDKLAKPGFQIYH